MVRAAESLMDASIVKWQCYEWPYAFPVNPYHDLFLQEKDQNLFLIGDAFGGPRVEGAALSGIMAAAEYLDQRKICV